MRVRPWIAATLALAPLLSSCTLTEVTLVESEDVVIAEVYVQIAPGVVDRNRVTAFLHRTLSTGTPASRPVPGAEVVITRADGLTLELGETSLETCLVSMPLDGAGTCYWAAPEFASRLQPGDSLELLVRLSDGGELRSAAVVPGDFSVLVAPFEGDCTVQPDTQLDVVWTAAAGTWAYVNETQISGLRAALGPKGITVEKDPLYLLGLSVAASDTTITLPGEFGVFERFDLDQGVSLALQKGLPQGTDALVTITAGERNYINWARGGNFNPSGSVQIPSIRGDGTGVFGASVTHGFHVYADAQGIAGTPRCGTP